MPAPPRRRPTPKESQSGASISSSSIAQALLRADLGETLMFAAYSRPSSPIRPLFGMRLGFAALYAALAAVTMSSAYGEERPPTAAPCSMAPPQTMAAPELIPAVYTFVEDGVEDARHTSPSRHFTIYFAPGTAHLTPAADRLLFEVAQLGSVARDSRDILGAQNVQYVQPQMPAMQIRTFLAPNEGGAAIDLACDRANAIAEALTAASAAPAWISIEIQTAEDTTEGPAEAFPRHRRAEIFVTRPLAAASLARAFPPPSSAAE